MNFNSFRDILTNPDFFPSIQHAIEFALENSFSSDCNGVFGSNFEISLCDEIMKLIPKVEGQPEICCMTNKEMEFYNSNSQYTIDCSNFNSNSWTNLKEEMKNLYHPISVSDIYLVKVDKTMKSIKIQDGLSLKTSVPEKENDLYLHNDAAGSSWNRVDNLVNNIQDPNFNKKIGNILIVRGNKKTGKFNYYFFDGTIEQIYASFSNPPKIGTGSNYVFTGSRTQAIVVTNRSVKGTGTSFNRGIKVKTPGFAILVKSGVLTEIGSSIDVNYTTLRSNYMAKRFNF